MALTQIGARAKYQFQCAHTLRSACFAQRCDNRFKRRFDDVLRALQAHTPTAPQPQPQSPASSDAVQLVQPSELEPGAAVSDSVISVAPGGPPTEVAAAPAPSPADGSAAAAGSVAPDPLQPVAVDIAPAAQAQRAPESDVRV